MEDVQSYLTEQKYKREAHEVAITLMDYLNSFDDTKAVYLAKELRREHRTMQQGLFRAIMELMSQWAKDADDNWYDDRNMATVLAAREIMRKFDKESIPYI